MNDIRPTDGMAPSWAGAKRRPRVVLLGSGDRPNVLSEAERLREVIERHAEIVASDFSFRQSLAGVDADFAIVLGGDGSILSSVKQMGETQRPVVGVNLGKLGFLADLLPEEFERVFPEVCRGECRIVEHLMFRCCVRRGDTELCSDLGLNEAAILGGPPYSMLHVDLYVDSIPATTYSCDGLIISTPVGSTAHSLSAGGPILRKNLQAFVISPISPHTLTVRPVVDSAERVLEAVVRQPNEATSVVIDGRVLCLLEPNDRVRVERAEPRFQLVEVRGHNYYRTLREKLGWGGAIRSKDGA